MQYKKDFQTGGRILAAVAVLFLTTAFSSATTLKRMSLGDLVRQSDDISVARCQGMNTHFGGANGRKIYTDYHFTISDSAKGGGRERITLSLLGGRIDPVELRVEGAPSFRVGDEVILFTRGRIGEWIVLTGYSQGVFPISTDPGTGRRFVLPPALSRVHFLGEEGTQGGNLRDRGRVDLDRFLDALRQIDRNPVATGIAKDLVP